MYHYRGQIIDVTDGDTFSALIDEGFGDFTTREFRMSYINAPEKSLPAGIVSMQYLKDWFASNPKFEIKTQINTRTKKDREEKWRRWLGEVFVSGGVDAGLESLNDEMVRLGLAVRYYDNRPKKK